MNENKIPKSAIVCIEPQSAGVQLCHEIINMGFKLVVVTQNRNDLKLDDSLRDLNLEIIECNTEIPEKIIECLVINNKYNYQAIIPGLEYFVWQTAIVAKYFNLKGLNPSNARLVRNKSLMVKKALHSNLSIPETIHINLDDIENASQNLFKFPLIAKPINLAASNFVKYVGNYEELLLYKKDYLNINPKDCGVVATRDILLQEFIDGDEYSIEGIINKKEILIYGITKKFVTSPPYFIETQHIFPAELYSDLKDKLYEYARSVVTSLGLSVGAFHLEVRIKDDNPVLIEIGARLPGGRICDLIKQSGAGNIYEAAIESYLGKRVSQKPKESTKFAGIRYIIRDEKMPFMSIDFPCHREYKIDYSGELLKPGVTIGMDNSDVARAGYVVSSNLDYSGLIQDLQSADDASIVNTYNKPTSYILFLNRWSSDGEFTNFSKFIDHNKHKVIYITNDKGAGPVPIDDCYDHKIVDDLSDYNELFAITDEIVLRLGSPEIIIGMAERDILGASLLRDRYNVAGTRYSDALYLRDKVLMKERLNQNGIKVPGWIALSNENYENEIDELRSPYIVKPRLDSSSMGVEFHETKSSLLDRIKDLERDIFEIEEHISGDVFHIDGFVSDNEIKYIYVFKYVNTCLDYLNGTPLGAVSVKEEKLRLECESIAEKSIKILGLDNGPFHLEVIQDRESKELYFLEVAGRVGGGEIEKLLTDITGIIPTKLWIEQQLGENIDYNINNMFDDKYYGYIQIPPPSFKSELLELESVPSLKHDREAVYDETIKTQGSRYYKGKIPFPDIYKARISSRSETDMLKTISYVFDEIRLKSKFNELITV